MINLTDEDIINAGVIAVQESIANKNSEIEKSKIDLDEQLIELSKIEEQYLELIRQRESLDSELKNAKEELGKLKASVWRSSDPNVVELRNQLLMAAKLIKE